MVMVFNSRTVKTMDEKIKDQIVNAGVPLEVYTKGIANLGPSNRTSIKRFANIAQLVVDFNLPLPPSPFIEFVADRTSGKSKQDVRVLLDGDPGTGKSITSTYEACRYAIEMADRFGQNPHDWFSLNNCALLEDTERITQIMDEAENQQAVLIDDSGTSLDSRDFATTSSKNMGKIMQTCRTKRWFLIFNVPRMGHVDLRIRELVTAKATLYRSFHAGGFNVMKINSSKITYHGYKKHEKNPRFTFDGKKISFYVAYTTDMLDPYQGMVKAYDKLRDEAGARLIHDIAGKEKLANNPGPSKREAKEQEMINKYMEKAKILLTEEGLSERAVLKKCPGMTLTYLSKIRAQGGF